jgi:glyoxylase-like metal-dependent hydrolase (beta-lactamase superfamily II)
VRLTPQVHLVGSGAGGFHLTDAYDCHVYLVDGAGEAALVDAGIGAGTDEILANVRAAGVALADVRLLLLTHAHPDHLWGVADAAGTRLLFPRAEYVLAGTERDFWTAPDLAGRMPDDLRTMVETTQQHLKTVAERVRTVMPGAEVVPGIATVDTAGHTPGHVSLHIVSGGEELLCTGDAISHPAVSFRRPDWHLGFDADPEQGAKVRRGLLDRCATDRPLVASYHLPFPGVGHVAGSVQSLVHFAGGGGCPGQAVLSLASCSVCRSR